MSSRETDRDALLSDERREQGYVLILPGVEGHSRWNRAIRRGLLAAGVTSAIEIHDWTRGPLWYFWNLRDSRRHQEQAQRIAEKIVRYRAEYPRQPVYVIGHSAGGALLAFALAALPTDVKVTAGIMLVPALSPGYDLQPALRQSERGLWSYSSYGDVFFVGVGTMIFGTCDGRHTASAGMLGFRMPAESEPARSRNSTLHQIRYHWSMLRHLNLGGHLSCVNPSFVRHTIAPLLQDVLTSSHGPQQKEPAR